MRLATCVRFPVLTVREGGARETWLTLGPRPKGEFVLTESFASGVDDPELIFVFFMDCARRFFPFALELQVDWPKSERELLSATFGLRRPVKLCGDSWLLPLFFAMRLSAESRLWPEGLFATGAVRRCGGMRCVSVADAVPKLRRALALGSALMLPKANVSAMLRAGRDVSSCVALPLNLCACLDIFSRLAVAALEGR